jgi:hypothetical protein
MTTFQFTFRQIRETFRQILQNGYQVIRCIDYVGMKQALPKKTLINRIDIDISIKKSEQLAIIFNDLGIKGTFFIRLHAPEYNPFSFENYRILKFIRDSGHEIGYHSEVVDESVIWEEPAEQCLVRDLEIINCMLGIKIKGLASHGGLTGLNNLDFWKQHQPREFGLVYEAYDEQPEFDLFKNSFYVSDSNWTYWKCYHHGTLVAGDHRTLGQHAQTGHPVIYSLIHADTFFHRHFYE